MSIDRVGDTVQPFHLLSSPSPPAFSLSQHQGLSQWVSSSHQVAVVLELQLQHESFQWIFRSDFLSDWLIGYPCCPRDSQESSPTPQFKSINSSCSAFFMIQPAHPYMTTGRHSQLIMCMCMLSCFSSVRLLATPFTVSCQDPLSIEFSMQEYWSWLPCPTPEGFPSPGIEPASLNISCIDRQVLYH